MRAQPRRSKAVFYGWRVVAASAVAQLVSAGIVVSSLGVFFTPLEQEFGWTRAQVSIAMSVVFLLGGTIGPLTGRLADRHGPRLFIGLGATLAGVAFGFISLVGALWQFYLGYALIAFARAGAGTIPLSLVVANWFQRRRALALGIASMGSTFGAMTIVPLLSFVVLWFGWRWAYVLMGMLAWGVIVPVAWLVMRNRPSDLGLLPDGDPAPAAAGVARSVPGAGSTPSPTLERSERAWTAAEAMRTRSFRLLCVVFALMFLSNLALAVHFIPLLEDFGIDAQTAATVNGIKAVFSLVGRVVASYVAHRLGSSARVIAACMVIQAASMLLLVVGDSSILAIWLFVPIYGLAVGGPPALEAPIVAESFGLKSLGTLLGILGVPQMVSLVLAPVAAGYIFDRTGSYDLAFIIFFVGSMACAVAAWMIRPDKATH